MFVAQLRRFWRSSPMERRWTCGQLALSLTYCESVAAFALTRLCTIKLKLKIEINISYLTTCGGLYCWLCVQTVWLSTVLWWKRCPALPFNSERRIWVWLSVLGRDIRFRYHSLTTYERNILCLIMLIHLCGNFTSMCDQQKILSNVCCARTRSSGWRVTKPCITLGRYFTV